MITKAKVRKNRLEINAYLGAPKVLLTNTTRQFRQLCSEPRIGREPTKQEASVLTMKLLRSVHHFVYNSIFHKKCKTQKSINISTCCTSDVFD
jgi:hypothetical protein